MSAKFTGVVVMWNSYVPTLREAARDCPWLDLKVYSHRALGEKPELLAQALKDMAAAHVILLYRTPDAFWDAADRELKEIAARVPVIVTGTDPSVWGQSGARANLAAQAYLYLMRNGRENFRRLLTLLGREVLGLDLEVLPPEELPWEGFYHPQAPTYFPGIEAYLSWYRDAGFPTQPLVGLMFSRSDWAGGSLELEDFLIRALEARGLGVVPIFYYSLKDDGLGTRGGDEIIRDWLTDGDGKSRIQALIKLTAFFLGSSRGTAAEGATARSGAELLQSLNIPLIQPLTAYYKTPEEWEADPQGLGMEVGWSVAMPEFEGVIEPMLVAAGVEHRDGDGGLIAGRTPVAERAQRLAERVARWVRLRQKPPQERKVAIILHNNPCASVEASVGAGAHLDTLESVARILHALRQAGYAIDAPPADGRELIETIMGRKAISEFRWTTVEEIVAKGGHLALIPVDDYLRRFERFPEKLQARLTEAWGEPPGRAQNGIPAAMVHQGRIVVTGVPFGHAVVCVQPKRGCAGSRCDGRVCKILHDPEVPPPHQYLATYQYLEEEFGADVIVHVGTHGNLEFLPGKNVALSAACSPDAALGTLPHLYIYNADNPPEGTIAKRRSYAALVDHMQTVLTSSGLYEELGELDRLLAEWERLHVLEPGRAHLLEHLIIEALEKSRLNQQLTLTPDLPFDEVVRRIHEGLSVIRTTHLADGMHIFGELPQGERRADFLHAVLRFPAADGPSWRGLLSRLLAVDLDDDASGRAAEAVDQAGRTLISRWLEAPDRPLAEVVRQVALAGHLTALEQGVTYFDQRLRDLVARLEASREMDALLNGLSGGYIPPGPSGLITRGRDDVLPTGRNFYSLDPQRAPTRGAWEVGKRLAQALIEKYLVENGDYPQNVALFWMANDIMWADGEGMAQIMALLGVRPVWQSNGRIKGFEVIPLAELKRPRIDVTVKVSGITRDNFPNCIELLDEAIQAVASLPEDPQNNYVRRHSLELLEKLQSNPGDGPAWRQATYRIFASKPGTYSAGTQLAVYASAWKEEADLAQVFLYWNGYAYGKGVFGEAAAPALAHSLSRTSVTYNKVVTDEYDLFGCCSYFGNHGGMTAAARHLSGSHVHTYFGDTRDPHQVAVRTLADEIRRVARAKLLNPKWIDGMKNHGYKGAGEISKRVGRVYGWEATTREVDDWIFDDITRTFVLNPENREFFEQNNPWALEEIARRLLEAEQRGLWQAAPQVLEELKQLYLEIEGWLEENMGEHAGGHFQGGAVDVVTAEEVEGWKQAMNKVLEKIGHGGRK
ncbi:MAG: cobaltochelatase subunit CobN [Deltaproteobacteria bacterium]|nr:cobaltochelatase subunit CobN [Deltaproteobacteria bacterium]